MRRAAFQFFISQDAAFLAAFARAYSLAAHSAEALHLHGAVTAIKELLQGVEEELSMHKSYAAVSAALHDRRSTSLPLPHCHSSCGNFDFRGGRCVLRMGATLRSCMHLP